MTDYGANKVISTGFHTHVDHHINRSRTGYAEGGDVSSDGGDSGDSGGGGTLPGFANLPGLGSASWYDSGQAPEPSSTRTTTTKTTETTAPDKAQQEEDDNYQGSWSSGVDWGRPKKKKQKASYARGGEVRRNFEGGGDSSNDGYVDYGRQDNSPSKDVNKELDKYYRDPLEGSQAKLKPAAPDDDDSIYGGTKPKWSEDAYNASQMQASGYANGGAVRQNFRRGGRVSNNRAAAYEEQDRLQQQAQAAEQQRYDAMDDHEKRLYQLNTGQGIDGGGLIYRGVNDTLDSNLDMTPKAQQELAYAAQTSGVSGSSGGGGGGGGGGDDYARGGEVRRNYDEGGYTDPMGAYTGGLSSDDDAAAVERVRAAEQAQLYAQRQAAERQVRDDSERQSRDTEALKTRDVEPPPPSPREPAPGPDRQAVSDLAARSAPAEQPIVDPSRVPSTGYQAGRVRADAALDPTGAVTGGNEPAAPVRPAALPPMDARQNEPVEPPARGPVAGPQPDATERPDMTSTREGDTPWYRRVYDGLLSKFQQEGGGPEKFFDPRRDAAPPEKTPEFQRLNPYARTPADDFWDKTADITKDNWIHRMLGGEKSYTMSELNDIQKQDPGRDIGGHLQDKWREAELKGDQGEAERIQQTIRHGFNTATTTALDRLNNGDLNGALQGIQHGLNMFTDDRKYELNPTTDGRVQIKITPEKPGMGEPTLTYVSPAQLRDVFSSNGGQFDHLMHNGVKETFDIATGRQKPLNVPETGYRADLNGRQYEADRPGYVGSRPVDAAGNIVANTEGGFHPNSAMGLMDRAQTAEKYGRRDPEAQDYANRAREAVRAGVAPDQVHEFLRGGGRASDFEGPPSPPVPGVQRTPEGRLAYNDQYDIPGSRPPTTVDVATGARTGADGRRYAPSEQFDGAGRYKGPTERLHSAPDVIGPRETYQTSQRSDRETSGKSLKRSDQSAQALYPSDRVNQPTGFEPYAYGERRAGSRAEGSPDDYKPIGRAPIGPPAPTGYQASAPAEQNVFDRGRGGGNALTPPRDYDRDQAIRYNQQLAERQNEYRPEGRGDTAYEARNRELNQTSGYAAAQDRQAAELKQATAAADKDYQTRQAEYDRVRNKYGYYNQELAEQDRAGNAPPIRYTDDWRHVPRPPTAAEQAEDIKYPRQLEMKTAPAQVQATGRENVANIRAGSLQTVQELRTAGQLEQEDRKQRGAGERNAATNQTRRDITTQTEEGKGARQQVSETGKNERGAERETGRNLRAADITADRRAHQQFLESKATQDFLQRQGSDDMKQFATTFRTKLQQGIKPSPDEVDNYNNLVDAIARRQAQPAQAAPAAAQAPVQVRSPEEAARLPKGTRFIAPDGRIGTS